MKFTVYPPQATSAIEVTNTPAGNISATDVQAAINELDTEKAPLVSASLVTPDLGVPTAGDLSACTGNASGLQVGLADALSGTAAEKLPSITVTQASNALTIAMVSQYMDFRNATLATGTPVTVLTGTPTDLVIPATSNLGMPLTAVSNRYAVLLAYNAGTPVLCVSNLVGGLQLDEKNLISPTTIGAASSSATTIYSAAACTASQPYKVVAIFDAVFTTGTGWSTPTLVQPGGQELFSGLGYGQTWQDVKTTPGRALGTTYYNTTGKPISVSIKCTSAGAQTVIVVNGVTINSVYSSGSSEGAITFIVPPGASYSATGGVLSIWTELR